MTPKELEQIIRSLLQQPLADAALREQLEQLAAAEISFSGFTWLFGPELYRRNRILFRPFKDESGANEGEEDFDESESD